MIAAVAQKKVDKKFQELEAQLLQDEALRGRLANSDKQHAREILLGHVAKELGRIKAEVLQEVVAEAKAGREAQTRLLLQEGSETIH